MRHLKHNLFALAALSASTAQAQSDAGNTIVIDHLAQGARANDEKMKHFGASSSDLGVIDGTATSRVKFGQFGAKHHASGAAAAALA